MLDLGRAGEAVADELAPFGEIGRAAEIDGVILHRCPAHEEAIAQRLLDRALELDPTTALGAQEDRHRLGDARLEFGGEPVLHVDLCDLGDHAPPPWSARHTFSGVSGMSICL